MRAGGSGREHIIAQSKNSASGGKLVGGGAVTGRDDMWGRGGRTETEAPVVSLGARWVNRGAAGAAAGRAADPLSGLSRIAKTAGTLGGSLAHADNGRGDARYRPLGSLGGAGPPTSRCAQRTGGRPKRRLRARPRLLVAPSTTPWAPDETADSGFCTCRLSVGDAASGQVRRGPTLTRRATGDFSRSPARGTQYGCRWKRRTAPFSRAPGRGPDRAIGGSVPGSGVATGRGRL